MTDNEIIEKYFKTRGWELEEIPNTPYNHWGWFINCSLKGRSWYSRRQARTALPQILTDFPAFKEHVLKPMQEEEYELWTVPTASSVGWSYKTDFKKPDYDEQVKDNNILHAAVIAATRYWESKQ